MDRAPIIDVDVPAGLDATLQMFGQRMDGVEVERDYEPGLPRISAYGGELNQVWTALIENALDAMGNARDACGWACRRKERCCWWRYGTAVRAYRRRFRSASSSRSSAPSRPAGDSASGLDQAMRIVRKHRGHISVESQPGSTCFRVRLPLDQLQAY